MPIETTDEQRQLLMQALDFDQSDLEANRAGTITSRQRQTFWQHIQRDAVGAVAAIVVGLLISYLSRNTFFLAFVVIALLVLAYDVSKSVLDLRSGSVERAEGNVSLNTDYLPTNATTQPQPGVPPNTRVRYKITVELQSFDVDERGYRAFQDNRDYLVYYTPYSRKILSAEGPRTYDTTMPHP